MNAWSIAGTVLVVAMLLVGKSHPLWAIALLFSAMTLLALSLDH